MRVSANSWAPDKKRWLIGLQRTLGLGPLSAYAAYHLWLNWPALAGRDAWFTRVRAHGLGPWLGAAVLAIFVLHAALGVWRTAGPRAEARNTGRFQPLTGVVLLLFLLYHVPQVWPPPSGAHTTVCAGYEQLWLLLGTPLALGIYVLGSAALAFHLTNGWLSAFDIRMPQALRSWTRYAAGAAGFALFFMYLQLVGWFALGEAVIPMPQPPAAELPR